ncbi:hypothetical protein LLG95_17355 [bacterium]|nr:hypothetical protein [bacterium]
MSVFRFSFLVSLALVVLASALAGCSRNKHAIEVDPRYSMNVVKTPYWFPDDKSLFPVERDVFDRYGAPEYMRLWWRDDGTFITSSDLSGKDKEAIFQDMDHMKKSWIYIRMDKEVVFSADHSHHFEQPITETLKLICQYGDPQRNRPVEIDGHTREAWLWMEHGKQALLEDGRLIKISNIGVGTGTGTIISK